MPNQKYTCVICAKKSVGYGNNAEPIRPGQCCDQCNNMVIMARMGMLPPPYVIKMRPKGQ